MKTTSQKSLSLFKYLAIFLFGVSLVYLASAYTSINTSLTNATQYIQKIILTSDGTQGGTTGISLEGNGDMMLAGNLTFINDLDPTSYYQPMIKSLGEDLTLNGRYGLRLTAGSNFTSYINMSNSDGKGSNPNIWFITQMTGDYLDERGQITFGQQYLDTEALSRRYQIGSYGEHHWYTGTGDDWAGIERMTIKDNGNVGIGVGNPTDNKLQIDGNITSHGFISRGTGVIASGDYSTAMGYETKSNGNYSTAMGYGTIANGIQSTAIGLLSIASGNQSIAIGEGCVSNGMSSIAMGDSTQSNGINSITMGFMTKANGESSLSIGRGNIANGFVSSALGLKTIANGDYSTVIGVLNEGIANSIFEIGIGTLDPEDNEINDLRRNAMTVLNNGKIGIGTTSPSASLTVEGGIKPIKATSDPCSDTSNYAEGTMFYNDNSDYYCFCDATTTAKQMHAPATSCF